ncbi:MAG TPA: chemotaxis protein CheW [Candidatus Competibacteraceae bacterium]|mgnify:FL=1|nr:MAG: chemotaxis protein CheW [Candidatus Competibacteraceae bacterium]HOB62663.1 chemotaxis protein CheW [Candidatus Competibacteraceae bacterium]HQA26016.1 chemotaxis protein CheW [Candidatus Competibacteraceae bacterium]HQD57966.1 chemotaxis protein CheW [Candidatus Competibacteraceae bacterium]
MADAVIPPSAAPLPLHPFDILLQLDQRIRERTPVANAHAQLSEIRGRLALRLGAWNLLFSMDDVAEIIPFPRITWVPGVKRWLLGIANLRGKVISVSDLRDFLTGRPTVRLPGSQVVVLRAGPWDYGLLADEIVGMRHFGPQHRLPSLEVVEGGLRPYVSEAFLNDNQQWLAFNTGKLLSDTGFLNAAN